MADDAVDALDYGGTSDPASEGDEVPSRALHLTLSGIVIPSCAIPPRDRDSSVTVGVRLTE